MDSFHHLTHTQTNRALSSLTRLQSGSEGLTQLAILLKDLAKELEKTRPMQRNLVILVLDTVSIRDIMIVELRMYNAEAMHCLAEF